MRPRIDLSQNELSQKRNNLVLEVSPYVEKIQFSGDEKVIGVPETRRQIAAKFLLALEFLNHHLPNQSTINVASLQNCTPDDFIALKVFYDRKFGAGKYQLNFFTFHTHSNQIHNQKHYSAFPELRHVHCDPTNKADITDAMRVAGVAKEGFDLVILRHSNFTVAARGIYSQITDNVIPHIAAKNAKVLFTFYDIDDRSLNFLHHKIGSHYLPLKANYAENRFGFKVQLDDGLQVSPDTHSVMLGCEGLAFEGKLKPVSVTKFSALSSQQGEVHQQLLKEFEQLAVSCRLTEEQTNSIKNALLERDYNKVLRITCHHVLVEHAELLLKHKNVLGINVDIASPTTNKTPLDWLNGAKDSPDKPRLLRLLVSKGATKRNVSNVTKSPAP